MKIFLRKHIAICLSLILLLTTFASPLQAVRAANTQTNALENNSIADDLNGKLKTTSAAGLQAAFIYDEGETFFLPLKVVTFHHYLYQNL